MTKTYTIEVEQDDETDLATELTERLVEDGYKVVAVKPVE